MLIFHNELSIALRWQLSKAVQKKLFQLAQLTSIQCKVACLGGIEIVNKNETAPNVKNLSVYFL